MTETVVKKKGRPPKTQTNLIENVEVDYNQKCIIPASNIIAKSFDTPDIDKVNYKFHATFLASQLNSFVKVINVLHSLTNEPCILLIDEGGLVFQHKEIEKQIPECIIRFFASEMKTFYLKNNQPFSISIQQNTLIKFLKNFDNKLNMSIFIFDNSEDEIINFEQYNKEFNNKRTYSLSYSISSLTIGDLSKMVEFKKSDFDLIIILNSGFFVKECKDMKGITQKFEIYCNNEEFFINFESSGISYSAIQGPSSSIKFIKSFESNSETFNKKMSTIAIHEYIKCSDFSKIVKFYLSKTENIPIILEFDIEPKVGTFQVFL
jgi:hypothetical protein